MIGCSVITVTATRKGGSILKDGRSYGESMDVRVGSKYKGEGMDVAAGNRK